MDGKRRDKDVVSHQVILTLDNERYVVEDFEKGDEEVVAVFAGRTKR